MNPTGTAVKDIVLWPDGDSAILLTPIRREGRKGGEIICIEVIFPLRLTSDGAQTAIESQCANPRLHFILHIEDQCVAVVTISGIRRGRYAPKDLPTALFTPDGSVSIQGTVRELRRLADRRIPAEEFRELIHWDKLQQIFQQEMQQKLGI